MKSISSLYVMIAVLMSNILVNGTEELESSTQTYQVTFFYNEGSSANISLFQTNPGNELNPTGHPVIFSRVLAEPPVTVTFRWTLDWALSWSDNTINPCPNIIYDTTGEVIPLSLTNNGAILKYADKKYRIFSKSSPLNIVHFDTDDSFSIQQAQADCLRLLVLMDGQPVFAMDGAPNMHALYDIKPRYYASTTLTQHYHEPVPRTAASDAYEIIFPDGLYDVNLCINDANEIYSCTNI
mmetsp:Transcript_25688/g.22453  ORF Transcript_25688/g.22453 Transcript_25688/m.22453 type:complete len:239 (-) Transcript_25688:104-820(-)